jgi:hypothetical protein
MTTRNERGRMGDKETGRQRDWETGNTGYTVLRAIPITDN